MKLVFLGTSGAQPTPERSLSCICLTVNNEILMFDAGEGAQISYMKSGLGWNKKMKIFVTHLHGDHCVGILGLLQTMSMQNRIEPIEIFGPDGIEDFISANVQVLNFSLSFPVKITPIKEGKIVDDRNYFIYSCEADHGIPAFSYVFQEKEKPGIFFPEKAKELGIPEGHLWHELQNGESIKIGDKIIRPEQVTDKKRKGIKIGISGDTRPTNKLKIFFQDCDYLSFDSTFSDQLKEKALETKHSTAKEAAELAKNANVRNLILTHFSARYKDEKILLDETRTIHASTITASDLLEIEIN